MHVVVVFMLSPPSTKNVMLYVRAVFVIVIGVSFSAVIHKLLVS